MVTDRYYKEKKENRDNQAITKLIASTYYLDAVMKLAVINREVRLCEIEKGLKMKWATDRFGAKDGQEGLLIDRVLITQNSRYCVPLKSKMVGIALNPF